MGGQSKFRRTLFYATVTLSAVLPEVSFAVPITASLPRGTPDYLSTAPLNAYFDMADTQVIDFEDVPAPNNLGSYFNLGSLSTTYYDRYGVKIPNGTRMGGQPGFGYFSGLTVAGNAGGGSYNGNIDIYFYDPATGAPIAYDSVVAWVADGPTNDSIATFYGLDNTFLGSIPFWNAFPSGTQSGFVGWSDLSAGIQHIRFQNVGSDDYYIDNLTFGSAPEHAAVPEPMCGMLVGLGAVAGIIRRRLFSS